MSRDGEVHINLGVLAKAASEDEVAFILAHEVAHYLLGHGINRDGSLRAGRGTINVARGASVYGITLASRGGASVMAGGNRGAAVGLIAAVTAGEALIAIAGEVTDASYSRTQELEADRLGLDLLIRAGYQPGATGSVFNQMASRHREQEARVVDLRGSVATGVYNTARQFTGNLPIGNPLARLGVELGTVIASHAIEHMAGTALSGSSHTHDNPDVRRADLTTYEQAYHNDVPDRDTTANPFTRGAVGREVSESMAALEVLRQVEVAITRDDPAAARAAMRGQDRLLDRRAPVRWRFDRARIAGMEGNLAEEGRLLAEANRHPQNYAMIHIHLARFLDRRGQTNAALQVLQQGEQSFGTAEPFIAERIGILQRANREAEMNQVLATCRTLNIGAIERACSDKARPQRPAVS
jgi:hypothetical protein